MTNEKIISKRVAYAYFSSDIAKKLGFAKTGCFFVELMAGKPESFGDSYKIIKGFPKQEEAWDFADKLPYVWNAHTYPRKSEHDK